MSISHKGMSDPEEKVNFEPSWDLMSGRPSLCSLVPAQGSKHNLLPGPTRPQPEDTIDHHQIFTFCPVGGWWSVVVLGWGPGESYRDYCFQANPDPTSGLQGPIQRWRGWVG